MARTTSPEGDPGQPRTTPRRRPRSAPHHSPEATPASPAPLPGGDPVRAPRRPAWTATLTSKAGLFIAVMCCALAALLGALVHVSVTGQTVSDSGTRR
ncbi:hypothetical protein O1L60_26330 [Streptomyces diastatochromogenes]|nr:hypothetical protein [Streptomyces diastatochromogenes]